MANYFISGSGTPNQTDGEFVVPTGTTIYFFSPAESLLEARFSDFFMDQLCTDLISPTAEAYVRALSVEVAPEGELVPNHVARGCGLEFRDPTGVYRVGQSASKGPVVRLLDGVSRTLKDLVSGISEGGSIGTHVYWGVCQPDRRCMAGRSPRQYFDILAAKNPPDSKCGRIARHQNRAGHSPPRGCPTFVIEKFVDQADFIDYPKFREFKARLRSGDVARDHQRA